MNIGLKILIGVCIFVACFGLPLILGAGALREIKEDKQDIIELKLNPINILILFLIHVLTFGASHTILFWLILSPPANFPFLMYFIIIPFVFFVSIDLVILISHIINEKQHTINWDRKQNIFSVIQHESEFQLDLNSDTLQIIHYYPPRQGGVKGFPG